MKILILGGNGFIGSHLVDRLFAEGYKVRVFDKYEERYRKQLPEVDYLFGEFGNRGLLAEALQDVDIVYHLISTSLPKTSNDDPAFDVQSNVIETIFLLEQCIARKVRKVIYVSSGGTVYGVPRTLPIPEDSQTEPQCSYGITKLTIEKYLALFNQLYGLDYAVVRPSNPYGSRQNPNGIQGAIPVFLGKAARGEDIDIWGDGTIVRDYIYIDDLIDGMYRLAAHEGAHKIFNMGSGVGYSLNEIVATIHEVTGIAVRINFLPGRNFDIPKIYLDISRARAELGWTPQISIHEGIGSTWEFVRGLYV